MHTLSHNMHVATNCGTIVCIPCHHYSPCNKLWVCCTPKWSSSSYTCCTNPTCWVGWGTILTCPCSYNPYCIKTFPFIRVLLWFNILLEWLAYSTTFILFPHHLAPRSNILQSICNYDGLHVIGNIKIGEVNYNFKFLEKIAYVHLPIAMFDSYLWAWWKAWKWH